MKLLGRLMLNIFIFWFIVGLGSYLLNWDTNNTAKILSIGTIFVFIGTLTKRTKKIDEKDEETTTSRHRSYALPWIGVPIFVFAALSFGFYWIQIRPAQIKHDCSWVRKYQAAVPAQPPMNATELAQKGIIHSCSINDIISSPKPDINQWSNINIIDRCKQEQDSLIEKYKNGTPEIPAKEWWEPATEDEYKFCLHDKGL